LLSIFRGLFLDAVLEKIFQHIVLSVFASRLWIHIAKLSITNAMERFIGAITYWEIVRTRPWYNFWIDIKHFRDFINHPSKVLNHSHWFVIWARIPHINVHMVTVFCSPITHEKLHIQFNSSWHTFISQIILQMWGTSLADHHGWNM